jgi:hypothetical protein
MKDLCLQADNYDKLDAMIIAENERQLEKWGVQDHSPAEWLMFATEELGEIADAIGEWQYRNGDAENVVKEAIQTATLCLKIAEMFIEFRRKR